MAPDAKKFIKLDTAKYIFAHTAPIVRTKPSSRGNGVRLIAHLVKRQDLTFEEFDRYWVEKHAHVVAGYPGFGDVFGLYEQVRTAFSQSYKGKTVC